MCDVVTMARPLIANNNLVQMFANGENRAPRHTAYCNKCLVNAVENPLGCYELERFNSRDEMVREIVIVTAFCVMSTRRGPFAHSSPSR